MSDLNLLAGAPCPRCQQPRLNLRWFLEAATGPVADQIPYCTARYRPWAMCSGCGLEARAQVEIIR